MQDVFSDASPATQTDPIVKRAHARYERCKTIYGDAYKYWTDDVKFALGDSDNNWQWPESILQDRDVDDRPALTVNKVRIHNLQIINTAKKTRPGIMYKAVGGAATQKAAGILEGIARHIEYRSGAEKIYGHGIGHQVMGGLGFWEVITDWEDSKSFNQEILLTMVEDPTKVFLDPDATRPDGSDANFGFIYKDLSREEFKQAYPEVSAETEEELFKDNIEGDNGWIGDDKVKVAKYFERVAESDELLAYWDEAGELQTGYKSVLGADLFKELSAKPNSRTRKVDRIKVMIYLLAGNKVVDTKEWAGTTIPIVPLPGEVVRIEGKLDFKGHTRYLKDAQRMYNFWTSAAAEQVALQGKTPWIVAAEAIEGHEDDWSVANTENFAYLAFNAVVAGQAMPKPERLPPPVMAQAYLSGLQVAQNEMMMASGQFQAELGEQTPERSGEAIQQRQDQADNATYHYVENLAAAVKRTGEIILELIPRIYDTDRIIKIIQEDGSDVSVQVDPNAPASAADAADQEAAVKMIFNPSLGEYEVQADMGPSFSTQREYAYRAIFEIMTQNPGLTNILGDILFDNANFPRHREAAERLRRMVPPVALGGEPAIQFQQMDKAIKALQEQIQKLTVENTNLRSKQAKDMTAGATDVYRAETDRVKALLEGLTPVEKALLVRQATHDALSFGEPGGNPIPTAALGPMPEDPTQGQLPLQQGGQ